MIRVEPFRWASAAAKAARDDREQRRRGAATAPSGRGAIARPLDLRVRRCRSRPVSRPRLARSAAASTVVPGLVVRGDRPDGEQWIECGDRAVRKVGRGSGSAATRHVSVSFSAISRAVANSIPRPITNIRPTYANASATAAALLVPGRVPRHGALPSGAGGRRSRRAPCDARLRAARSPRAGSRTSSSRRPRARARRRAGASVSCRASSGRWSFVIAIVSAPRSRARST